MESGEPRPSKSRRKREMLELQALGEALIDLPQRQLAEFELPTRLREAIEAARRMSKRGALCRQRQYIGRLMREVDADAVRARFARITAHERARAACHAAAERWRARLLEEPAAATEAFLAICPAADRERLHRLAEEARAERAGRSPSSAARVLFRYVRQQLEPPT